MTPLEQSLYRFGIRSTGNNDWDKEVLHLCQQKQKDRLNSRMSLASIIEQCEVQRRRAISSRPDLSNPDVFDAHHALLLYVANEIILAPQRRRFVIDQHNSHIIRFLLYYFNECPLAENVFPDRGYKLHKNIMLQGGVGVGKTMMMQIFSEYLRLTSNPRHFHNVSVTQMVNYYTIHNNIDRFLYNEENSRGFQINPVHLCLNDIGVDNRPFYGVDTTTIVNDFLHGRNEIWANREIDRKFAHLTTNLSIDQLKKLFAAKDSLGRIQDRFKTYNVIPFTGTSRR